MPTPIFSGTKIENIDMLELIPADEGSINQYYGHIGSGKTYTSTADLIDDLNHGKIVYCNWIVKWDGYDERKSRFLMFLGILGLKKRFLYFPPSNLHYLPIDGNFLETLEILTDCKVYIDEGHIAFDSYEMARMNLRKRAAVLHTRHFDRCINIISQRPTAIHVTLRANVNRFFKCEKIFSLGRLVIFRKTEYQDLVSVGETVDETKPIASNWYFGKKYIFSRYNSKYLRGDVPRSQDNNAELYFLTWKERFKNFFGKL